MLEDMRTAMLGKVLRPRTSQLAEVLRTTTSRDYHVPAMSHCPKTMAFSFGLKTGSLNVEIIPPGLGV